MADMSPTSSKAPLQPTAEPTATSIALPPPFHNTSPAPELITQGAEAHLYKTCFLTPARPAALKIRPAKPYRHPTLDARLTKQRVLAEARVLNKLACLGIGVPKVYSLDWDMARGKSGGPAGAWLLMEWVEGRSLKEVLRDADAIWRNSERDEAVDHLVDKVAKNLLRSIGRAVGKMHNIGGVVHGDLTSSNIMVLPKKAVDGDVKGVQEVLAQGLSTAGEIVLIDFGLATQSIQDEDRAVDLYVLEKAFGSTHPRQEGWFKEDVLDHVDGYRGSFKGASVVLKRLEEVRMRGRKRSMVG